MLLKNGTVITLGLKAGNGEVRSNGAMLRPHQKKDLQPGVFLMKQLNTPIRVKKMP